MSDQQILSALPHFAGAFVGRDLLLEQTSSILARSNSRRLLTLTGPGGIGKTRLAAEVARAAAPAFPDGVVYLPLASESRPDVVIDEIARAIEVESPESSRRDVVFGWLAGREMLLVLDNIEQIELRPLCEALITACPNLRLLCTSTGRLGSRLEHVIEIGPLSTSGDGAGQSDAALLLLDRMAMLSATSPNPPQSTRETVDEICGLVDGIPLALELVAGWGRVLTPSELRDELLAGDSILRENRFSRLQRHETMDAAIAWTLSRLTAQERAAFLRLSTFVGGFTRSMAERILAGREPGAPYVFADGFERSWYQAQFVGFDPTVTPATFPTLRHLGLESLPIATLDLLSRFVDFGLVRRVDPDAAEARFQMLEPIRRYGLELLATAPDADAIRHAHATTILPLIEVIGEGLYRSHEALLTPDRFEQEIPNLLAATEWALSNGEAGAELAQRLVGPSWIYWYQTGRITEGRQLLRRALTHETNPFTYADHLPPLGLMAWIQGDTGEAERILLEARTRVDRLGLRASMSGVRQFMAMVKWTQGDHLAMFTNLQESLVIAEEIQDQVGIGVSNMLLGLAQFVNGDYPAAVSAFDRSREMSAACGNLPIHAHSSLYSGQLLLFTGDPMTRPEGLTRLGEAFDGYRQTNDIWGLSGVAICMAAVMLEAGSPHESAVILGIAEAWNRAGSTVLPPLNDELFERTREGLRQSLTLAELAHDVETGASLGAEQRLGIVRDALIQVERVLRRALAPPVDLTNPQRQVVELLREGLKPPQIAARRGRTIGSVYELLETIRTKVGVDSWELIVPALDGALEN